MASQGRANSAVVMANVVPNADRHAPLVDEHASLLLEQRDQSVARAREQSVIQLDPLACGAAGASGLGAVHQDRDARSTPDQQ